LEEKTSILNIQNVSKQLDGTPVLNGISLTAQAGEFISLVGPSGCGKSTLLHILAGLETPDSGTILLNNATFNPNLPNCAFMPQRDALFAWRTALDNAILGLQIIGVPKAEARQRALSQFELFGLKGFEKKYPWQLSGGMRQRLALLRTVLLNRQILLLDEPFGALDALTRSTLQEWLLNLQEKLNRTILFVTHDIEEALLLSDKVYVLTARPASVRLVKIIDLPRPRLSTNPRLIELKAELLAALRQEVQA
jgi:ABC-type nitrate/sulfonate/bicarbonate transport system ATPase subunit